MKALTLTTQRYGQCISFCGQTNGQTDTLKTIMPPIYRCGGIKMAKFKRQFLNQGSRHFKKYVLQNLSIHATIVCTKFQKNHSKTIGVCNAKLLVFCTQTDTQADSSITS